MDLTMHTDESKYTSLEPFKTEGDGTMKNFDENAFVYAIENIGRATTGKVHLMVHKKSGYVGIMKVIPLVRRKCIESELNMLKVVRDCRFMVRLVDNYIADTDPKDNNIYIFLEYAPFKSLDHLTTALKGLGSVKAKDVKPENVFIRSNGHTALGDMGLAMDATGGCKRICGTFVTRPLEVWQGEVYSLPIDVWMYGISLYNLMSNKWPFMSPSKSRQIDNIKALKYSFDAKFCEASSDLIRKCLQVDANTRLKIKEILKHEYFSDVKPPLTAPYTPQELLSTYKFNEAEGKIVEKLLSQK